MLDITQHLSRNTSTMNFSTSSSRWTALTTRDRLADAHFVYAVKTTKIYCRPSCAARLARRANVEFYSTPAAASKAGFRACKRCKPEQEAQQDPQDVAVAKACEIIRAALSSSEHANGHIGLNELAERVELTPSYLHKTFKAKMGMSPKKYAESLRQHEVSVMIAETEQLQRPDTTTIDAYSVFWNDLTRPGLDLCSMGGLGAESDTAAFTSGEFSGTSTSLNTPSTADWSWLDASISGFENCEFFDANAVTQTMLPQDQTQWNDPLYPLSERDWEMLPDSDARQDVFEMNFDTSRTYY